MAWNKIIVIMMEENSNIFLAGGDALVHLDKKHSAYVRI